jgi:phenylacetate-coenzyme A ligase PaaK-like adenylate-forming protein
VQLMEPGTLERTEFKAKRVIDQRRIYGEITGQK